MAIEVHTYLVDVQSLHTSVFNIVLLISGECNVPRDCNFVLTSSSVYCVFNLPQSGRTLSCRATYLCRDGHISAGQPAYHHTNQGMLR